MSLKLFFSKELTDPLGSAQIVATDSLPQPRDGDIPSLPQALPIAMNNRPELPEGEGVVSNDEVAVQVTHNLLRPTLNVFELFATAGLYGNQTLLIPGVGPAVATGGLAQELTQFARFKYPEYAAGFALTIPLRNRSAQADSTRAQLDQRQAETILQRTRNQIGLEVRNAIITAMQAKARLASAEQTLKYNQEAADAEQRKLQIGVSTAAYNVVLTQRDLETAQLAEVTARTAYANALVELERATGVILEKNHLDLEARSSRVARSQERISERCGADPGRTKDGIWEGVFP